jgi:gas vesicle protein
MASSGDKFIYFLMGGFIGASVAVLLAPKSGEETRRFLEDKYKEGTDQFGEKTQEGRDFFSDKSRAVVERVGETIERGKETIQQQKEQVTAAFEAGAQAYENEKRKLKGVGTKKKKKSVS